MGKGRLEAFSDGVVAIIITIMVLEMRAPHRDNLDALKDLLPVFVSYLLSFINIGIYWNNHHHMMHLVHHIEGKVLWANMHLLFWLSLVPFATAWMGENHFTPLPVAVYGIVLFFAGVAYYILAHTLIHLHGKDSSLAVAIGKDQKGKISVLIYFIGILLCAVNPWLGISLYAVVTAMWLIPDQRIEKKISHDDKA
jgi:uncharacterized membrane protein